VNYKAILVATSQDSWQAVREYLEERLAHWREKNDTAVGENVHVNQGAIAVLKELLALDSVVRSLVQSETERNQ